MEDQPENLENLDQALDEMDNKLNLTADEKDNGTLPLKIPPLPPPHRRIH